MPRLLYRYILVDLLRTIGLTVGVLVTVIAFGATLKPLASNMLLDAGQTAKYLGLVIVPMLQFALPFAAGFGATLCLHRMVADNEVQAMAVSGISYRRILTPVIALGLALTLCMVLLTQLVIPRFWSLLEQMITTDLTKMFQATILRKEPFAIKDLQIYADDIHELPVTADGQLAGEQTLIIPQTRLILLRVVAAKFDNQGRILADVTGRQAAVDIYRHRGRAYLKLALDDTVAFNGETGDLSYLERVSPQQPVLVPSVLEDNPKAFTRGQLLALRRNPDEFGQVIEAKDALIAALRDVRVRNKLDDQLRRTGKVELLGPMLGNGPSRRYVIQAHRLQHDQFVDHENKPIEVVQFEGQRPVRRFDAQTVRLGQSGSGSLDGAAFDLILESFEVTDLVRGGPPNQRAKLSLPDLTVSGEKNESLAELSSGELLKRADEEPNFERVREKTGKLINEIQSLQREITSRLLNRYALSVTAFLLLLLGATLAMCQRSSLPLTIYTWAFLPSIIDLILISTGEQLLRDGRMLGHAVMWSGNGMMLLMIVLAYFKLARH